MDTDTGDVVLPTTGGAGLSPIYVSTPLDISYSLHGHTLTISRACLSPDVDLGDPTHRQLLLNSIPIRLGYRALDAPMRKRWLLR